MASPAVTWWRRIVVLTLENHSFDQIFGSFPGAAGLPNDVVMPAPHGAGVRPYAFRWAWEPLSFGPPHSFADVHEEWNQGRMDGFVRVGGRLTMGHYRPEQVRPGWDWAKRGRLLDHYFCAVLGPTLPNRLYLIAGESGGITDESPPLAPPTLEMDTVFDQLTQAGVGWRYYVGGLTRARLGWGWARLFLLCPLLAFPRFMAEPRLRQGIQPLAQFFTDVAGSQLPDVSFIAPGPCGSGHPPTDLPAALALLTAVAEALAGSPDWSSTLLVVNWDEAGGFYDHLPPPVRDRFGPGLRVPALLLSGSIAPGVDHGVYDHTSVLRAIEERWGLPLLGARTREMASLGDAVPPLPS